MNTLRTSATVSFSSVELGAMRGQVDALEHCKTKAEQNVLLRSLTSFIQTMINIRQGERRTGIQIHSLAKTYEVESGDTTYDFYYTFDTKTK